MEALKRQRKALRTSFTKAHTAFILAVDNVQIPLEEKMIAFELLENKMAELNLIHSSYNKILCENAAISEEDLNKEMESDDLYKTNFLKAKMKVTTGTAPQMGNSSSVNSTKLLKLPSIELPRFHGTIKEWLPFWSQFKKVHENTSLTREDKFQYLIQATAPGSRAHEIISSFPPTAGNYEEAIACLKNRFGRDDVVVEFYVRELLGLVLQNAVSGGKKQTLSNLYDKVESNIRALNVLGVTTDKCAAMLYPLVESSLPEEVLRAWQRSGQRETINAPTAVSTDGEAPTKDRLTLLLAFLQREVENEERIGMALTGFGIPTEHEKNRKLKGKTESNKEIASASALFTVKEEIKSSCIFCKASHESANCNVARKLSMDERRDILKKENVCFVCLKHGHISKRCRVKVKCDWCAKRHVLLMCPGLFTKENSQRTSNDIETKAEVKGTPSEHSLAAFSEWPDVCLQTLRIKMYSDTHEKVVRAIIDSGSHRSYVREEVARELGYISHGKQEVKLSLFGGVKSSGVHEVYNVRLKNIDNSYACNFIALNKDVICEPLKTFKISKIIDDLKAKNIVLSDSTFNSSSIDLLIGADVAGRLMTGKKYDFDNGLTAFETFLGWTLMGKLHTQSPRTDSTLTITSMFIQEASLANLWRLDIIGISDPIEKLEKVERDKRARDFLVRTTYMTPDNRYVVKLPWVEEHVHLPSNYDIARTRLEKGIQKLKKQNLYTAYEDIFKEWLTQGIIERVPDNEINDFSHYLPHRPVIKLHGTTKIRPVFDASACKTGYPSLNQCLEVGPNLIELVPATINRLREGEIGVVSDIKKAFLQIVVDKSDRNYLRFLWKENDKIIEFRHCRVVFGLVCSPFILAAIIELLLNKAYCAENVDWSKETITKLRSAFYVDNCVTSVNSVAELNKFVSESTAIMASGGFELRGWENSGNCFDSETSLVLGMRWDKKKDTLGINMNALDINIPDKVTKRTILSIAHKVYDPIGLTSPVSLQPKLLLQSLWEDKLEWDTEISIKKRTEFLQWLSDLFILKEIEIPRKLERGKLSLHCFGDASGSAYAAVIFARIETNDHTFVHLLNAKARVAPKKCTIPRLELMAATIAVRLASSVVQSLTREIISVTYWTDSTTVLAWINRDLDLGTFVRNRVKEIRSSSKLTDWKYVPGNLNPADLPSRGCSATFLKDSKWWLGPQWLYHGESVWPELNTYVNDIDENSVNSELKKTPSLSMTNVEILNFEASKMFSSYTKLLRFLAWMNRFFENCKVHSSNRKKALTSLNLEKEKPKLVCLTKEEIDMAEIKLFKFLQKIMFQNMRANKLTSFRTFRDENDLYVLKTKIFNRNDDRSFICPILLDCNHDIIFMLVREQHEKLKHAGSQIIISNLRDRFWIISVRKVIRSVISKCVVCQRQNAKRMECESPPLPVNRVRDARIFEIVGVDFAGPLFIKGGGKGWICLFTCAIYRAVHLELASSLSVDGFLECLRRFIARCGRPTTIYSDNGTNFTGTNNAFNSLDWSKIMKHSSMQQIQWYFNPASAPWWGGWWERLIGILKTILRKILGRACLTYESLTTVLCDAQAVINSRPLTYLSEDSCDLKPLSPAMFLHEMHETGVPDCDMIYHEKLNKKLKHRQQIMRDLRVRFRSEYLGQLLLKNGKKENRKLNIGDVVLIGDDTRKRVDWPLGRIVNCIRGQDGNTRVFILKTKNGLIKRPLQRLYPLECSRDTVQFTDDLRAKAKTKNDLCKDTKLCNEMSPAKNNKCKIAENYKCKEVYNEKTITTRSGRISQRPKRYND